MTSSYLNMLYFFACDAHNIIPDKINDIDFNSIYKLSMEQGVMPIVHNSLKKIYDNDLIKEMNGYALASVFKSINKKYFVHKVLNDLKNNNINYCCLKGETLSILYANPELRISGDTDIYVYNNQKKKTLHLLKKQGFDIEKESGVSHHIQCTHEKAGLFEVHYNFYNTLQSDIWFDNQFHITEPFANITVDNTELQTLGITDCAIFTCLHMIKHFLSGGISIRHIMDTLLYFKEYNKEIKWNRFNDFFAYLKYDKFIEYIKGIGIKYLLFKKEDFNSYIFDEGLSKEILDDCEHGGLFGFQDADRHSFYQLYTKERFSTFNDQNNYNKYMKNWKGYNFYALFGKPEILYKQYPYCNKYKFLLPIASINRMIDFIIRFINKKENIKKHIVYTEQYENTDNVKKRIELLDKLGMI